MHSDFVPEDGCDGVLIELEESSTEILTVARCVKCGTHFKYVPDASWVTVVLPGMKSRLV